MKTGLAAGGGGPPLGLLAGAGVDAPPYFAPDASDTFCTIPSGLRSLSEPVRVTVEFDDVLALDVTAPGTAEKCSHRPVHRYAYELPAGPLVVAVTTGAGQSGSAEVWARMNQPITAPWPLAAIWQLSTARPWFSVSRAAEGARRRRA